MGVDWITCAVCGENFPDCGPCGKCSNCESQLCHQCHKEQVEKYGNPDPDSDAAQYFGDHSARECDMCSGKIIHNHDMLNYLLEKLKMTKDQVIEEIKKERGIN